MYVGVRGKTENEQKSEGRERANVRKGDREGWVCVNVGVCKCGDGVRGT